MRRLALLLLTTAASVLLLEGILQASAYVVWHRSRKPVPEIPTGHDVILCVGDSWTEGMGSSDPAKHGYPAVLERLIRERHGTEWVVVNGGQAGQDSRDVLGRLPSQLEEFRPSIVCVLVGFNDFWSLPEEVAGSSESVVIDHRAFRFRWRIPRLVAWASAAENDDDTPRVVIVPKVGPAWQPRRIAVADPYPGERRKWKPSDSTKKRIENAWRLAAAKDDRAIRELEIVLSECPEHASAHRGLVSLYAKNNRPELAEPHLEWLRDSFARDNDYHTGRELVTALIACARHDEVLTHAASLLQRYPDDARLWFFRGKAELFLGKVDDAKSSIERSIELEPTAEAFRWLQKVHTGGFRDYDAAITTIYRGYVVLNDHETVARLLRGLPKRLRIPDVPGERSRLEELADSFDADPEIKSRLVQIVREVVAVGVRAGAKRVLAAHLQRVASVVFDAGATPVFLGYPLPQIAGTVLQEIAAEHDLRFIDVRPRFLALIGDRAVDEFRSPDGHVNDEGYYLMARAIADGLHDLLAR